MGHPNPEVDSSVDWMAIAANVRGDEPKGTHELYRVFSRGIRLFLRRKLGPHQLEARVQETFTVLVGAIRLETLRQDEPLVRSVRAVVLKQIDAYINQDLQSQGERRVGSPGAILDSSKYFGQDAMQCKNQAAVVMTFRSMSIRAQEALVRFYVYKQSIPRICEEMQLRETQFLLWKTGARVAVNRSTSTMAEDEPDAMISGAKVAGQQEADASIRSDSDLNTVCDYDDGV